MFGFDSEFIDRLLKKDQSAFDAFYVKTVDIFFRYVKSHYVIDAADIQDLLADVFCKIWISLDKYDPSYPFDRYVWTILKNRLKDYFKKSKDTSFSSYNQYHELPIEEILMSDEDVEEQFQKDYLWEDIDKSVKHLDEFSQDLLHFRFVEQKSYDEIAKLTGISAQNLRKKLSRIVATLRKKLQND